MSQFMRDRRFYGLVRDQTEEIEALSHELNVVVGALPTVRQLTGKLDIIAKILRDGANNGPTQEETQQELNETPDNVDPGHNERGADSSSAEPGPGYNPKPGPAGVQPDSYLIDRGPI